MTTLPPPDNVTELLTRAASGDRSALERFQSAVNRELRQLARHCMRGERIDHTLQPTALVNEAYLRLFEGPPPSWHSRQQFFRVAARSMRQILVDHARSVQAQKRGGGWQRISSVDLPRDTDLGAIDILALHEALETLQKASPRKARVVELRFFAGLSSAETAEALEISERTVERDWMFARAWLAAEMEGQCSR